ncbi:hypothetical protein PtA15_11A34 [Puccinia triticina]|uniref:Uncharacterized protein n=1 Tax=Puccinia triticina TaxID=208348 RepID=A0ABY7CY29_9BASI|nr:uncharacterized protein PtA15_11A34 [Puccinia triticina]WAQ89347.1 hypothetical protein PtA15_11A34 [Puccinia triticina]WAR59396.1 hypothetical protein PtB15_11B36 [Puccinia triticina]
MILSPFAFLFLCLAPSHASLLHYTHHRRALLEGAADMSRVAGAVSHGAESSTSTRGAIELAHPPDPVSDSILAPLQASDRNVQLAHRPEVDPGKSAAPADFHPPQNHNPAVTYYHPEQEFQPLLSHPPLPPKLSWTGRLKFRLRSKWNNIYLFFRRAGRFLSPASPRRIFSYASKLQSDFKKLPANADHTQGLVRKVVTKIFKSKSNFRTYLRVDPKVPLSTEAILVDDTTKRLVAIREFINVDHELALKSNSEAIEAAVKNSLKLFSSPSSLANHLASLNARELAAARLGIRTYAGGAAASLADLHGFLGPENVFASQLTLILHDESIVGRLPDGFKLQFAEELKGLQTHLSEMARYQSEMRIAGKNSHSVLYPYDAAEAIENFAQKQTQVLGGQFENFQAVMSKIKKSDPYKAFQMDLNFPNSAAGRELQFIKPLWAGQGFDTNTMSFAEAYRLKVGFKDPVKAVKFLAPGQDIPAKALENTLARFKTEATAQKLKQDVLDIYSRDGYKLLREEISTSKTIPL